MTITASAPTASAATAATDTTTAGRTRLAQNFDMFLTLLTTQMKAQDPLSPMDSNQFTAQLVQMTGVEQQLAANDLLKQLVANTGSNLSSAVGLIGKQVRAVSTDAALSGGKAQWTYNLPSPASDVKLEVLDKNGRVVYAAAPNADGLKAGDHGFTWDGKGLTGAQLPEGTYTLRVTAKDGGGQALASTTYVQGLVSGIEQSNGQAVITINGGKVPIGQVVSVSEPPASTTTTNPTSNTADQTSAQAA